jgi:hypothetical protein
MINKVQIQVSNETREFIKQNISIGDMIKITMCLDDTECDYCDYDIGMDDGMFESEGEWLRVDRVTTEYSSHLQCGSQVVDARSYLWSTCWISEVIMYNVPRPSWEL